MSASGGAPNALLRGKAVGATAIQLFTSNQKQWRGRNIQPEEIDLWKSAQEETGIKTTISHDSYLINLGSDKPDLLEKSLQSFQGEIERCQLLDITYLNFHPGVATNKQPDACLEQIVKSLLSFAPYFEKPTTTLLLETTAGQGNSVGHTFEHLHYIIDRVKGDIPIGVCIDTCHIFAAGYDISTEEGFLDTLATFDKIIGLSYLKAFHLNDSLKPLGSRRDRHASLGKGEIGPLAFELIATHPKTRLLPLILETPNPDLYAQEIQELKNYAKNAHP